MPPKLATALGDPLYFTTKPGARAGLFYAMENTDPRVIEADEATKDQVSVPGMGTVAVFGICSVRCRTFRGVTPECARLSGCDVCVVAGPGGGRTVVIARMGDR
jgi:hypothetical protein